MLQLTELTDGERRLILRGRKRWYRWLRRGWHTLSVLLVSLAVLMPAIVWVQINKKLDYQNSVEAIQAVARTGNQPTFFIPANRYAQSFTAISTEEARLAADYVDIFMSKSDSLGLTADKRLGMRLEVTVVPCGLFGQRHSAGQLKLYSSYCGCDTDSLTDETVLQIDSSGTKANVISSRTVTLVSIQP
ncbi:MAG: hypothetical protein WC544_04840 [Patescibacteria group bacterium]